MSWIAWDYKCEECNEIHTHLMKRGEESDYVYCDSENCNGQCYRMYGGHPNTRISASIPDGVTTRLDKIKLRNSLRRERDAARQRGDRQTEKKISNELRKVKK